MVLANSIQGKVHLTWSSSSLGRGLVRSQSASSVGSGGVRVEQLDGLSGMQNILCRSFADPGFSPWVCSSLNREVKSRRI